MYVCIAEKQCRTDVCLLLFVYVVPVKNTDYNVLLLNESNKIYK